jgi:hypothetical protein
MHYSATTKGFYVTSIHGARQMEILDPTWVRPTITVILQPGESYPVGEQVIKNTSDIPTTLVDVLDVYAVHPTITVDNPDCKIPADAVEISDEQHAALMQGQSEGKVIGADEGGFPLLLVPPVLPPSENDFKVAVQGILDAKAQELNYDGILSLCSYASSTNPVFAAEAAAGATWRDAAWAHCYQALDDVQNNLRQPPTVAELVAELPAMNWPV